MLLRPHDKKSSATPNVNAPAIPGDDTPATPGDGVPQTPGVTDLEALLVLP